LDEDIQLMYTVNERDRGRNYDDNEIWLSHDAYCLDRMKQKNHETRAPTIHFGWWKMPGRHSPMRKSEARDT